MKIKPFPLIFLAISCLARAEVIPPAMDQHNESCDLLKLKRAEFSLVGKVIAVRFNYRNTFLRETAPGLFEGRLALCLSGQGSDTFTHFNVVFSKEGLAWFERLPTDSRSPRPTIVFAEVMKNSQGRVYLRLVGWKVKVGMSGGGTEISW